MRLFELRPSGNRPRLAFHPRITVIRGLEDDGVEDLKLVLKMLAAGVTTVCDGTVEVHGVLISLKAAARLVGPSVGEPVIAPIEDVLPPVPGPPRGGPGDPVVASHVQAVAACDAIEVAVADLARELASAADRRDDLQARLRAETSRIDRQLAIDLDIADSELRKAARVEALDPYVTLPDPESRVDNLVEVIEDCDRVLLQLPSGDRAMLAAATSTLNAALSSGRVISPEAATLAEVWLSLHRRLDGIESRLDTAGTETEAVAARLEEARAAAEISQAAVTPREVTKEEDARLEEMQSRIVDLQRRATTGVRRGSAKKQLDDVHAQLQGELDALGYPTFMAYRLGNGLSTVDPAQCEQMEAAMVELEEAESEWAELMARLESDHELKDVLVAIEQVSKRATELLDIDFDTIDLETPEALAERLRGVVVDAAGLGVDAQEASVHLQSVLDEAGAGGHRDVVALEGVMALGESWLEVLRAADDAAVRVLRDRERAETELAAIEMAGPSPGADLLAQPRSNVIQAEAAASELRSGLTASATVRLELHELAAAELAAAEHHDAKLELLAAARTIEELAEARLPSNIRLATARRGITALVPRGVGGAVPMMVELGDVDDGSLEQLLAVPDDVQVIAIGGGSGVLDWVESLGPTHASLVEIGAHV
jgi:hypothetical protein